MTKTKGASKKSGHYVNGRQVTEILNAYHEKRKALIESGVPDDQLPPLPDEVGMAIKRIAEGYSRKFTAASDPEEMIGYGIFLATENLAKIYDPSKSKTKNCFSLITQLVYFGFLNYFTAEKKAKREQNSFLEALADGQVSIGNEIHDQNHNTSLKELRKIVDEYKLEQERDKEGYYDQSEKEEDR
uniref:Late sigma transcription factor n=1 Tax=Ochrobactrum phage ORM_20 TaxID=2985243 RepID=A0A9N6WUX3_9VIRU|nr:late sigma transcription factor [Ochrobactrum phage ORM_20]